MILDLLKSHDGIALIDGEKSITYGKLLEETIASIELLLSQQINPGAIVCLDMKLSWRSLPYILALLSNKNIVIPNDDLPKELWDAILIEGMHDYHIYFSENELIAETKQPMNRECDQLAKFKQIGNAGLIIATSGSSGKPKLVLHDLDKMLERHKSFNNRTTSLAMFHYDHIAGYDRILRLLSSGSTLVLASNRRPTTVAQLIETHRIDEISSTPLFWREFINSRVVDSYNLASLRSISFGADRISEQTLSELRETLPWVEIRQSYGTSELGSLLTETCQDNALYFKFREDGVHTKIVDDKLWIKSPVSMIGYLSSDRATIDGDGFMDTGDIVESYGNYFRITGKDRLIFNIGGEKFMPSEIEDLIETHPMVSQAVVRQMTNQLGSFLVADVVLSEYSKEVAQIRSELKRITSKLASFKRPSRYRFVSELKSNTRMKICRKAT